MTATDTTTEPRRYLRVPVQVEVIWGEQRESRSYATNLSIGGVCLQSATHLDLDQELRVRFRLGPACPFLDLPGRVVWCTEERDMAPGLTYCEIGIRFLEISGDDRVALEEFVDQSRGYQEVTEPEEDTGWHG